MSATNPGDPLTLSRICGRSSGHKRRAGQAEVVETLRPQIEVPAEGEIPATRLFGEDFKPDTYIEEEYKRIKSHKWYEAGRLITVNDIYSFDPNAVVHLNDFVDIIGRNFKQPKEGLGFDNTPSSHMWRTLMWPTRYL